MNTYIARHRAALVYLLLVGAVAQLGEHLSGRQRVRGSSPLSSTKLDLTENLNTTVCSLPVMKPKSVPLIEGPPCSLQAGSWDAHHQLNRLTTPANRLCESNRLFGCS